MGPVFATGSASQSCSLGARAHMLRPLLEMEGLGFRVWGGALPPPRTTSFQKNHWMLGQGPLILRYSSMPLLNFAGVDLGTL